MFKTYLAESKSQWLIDTRYTGGSVAGVGTGYSRYTGGAAIGVGVGVQVGVGVRVGVGFTIGVLRIGCISGSVSGLVPGSGKDIHSSASVFADPARDGSCLIYI